MLSSMSRRGVQDGFPTSWQQNRRNKGWQSQEFEPNGPKRFPDDVADNKFWISFLNVVTWCGWPKMNHARRSSKTGFRSRKRMFTISFNTPGPVVFETTPDKAKNKCHALHNFSFAKGCSVYSVNGTESTSVLNPVASRQCSSTQRSHHTDVDVPWWQWYPFDEISTILTQLGSMRFLALC